MHAYIWVMTITISETQPDPIQALVFGWVAGKRSVHTRLAYARDAAEWLGWCAEHGIAPLTAREPDVAMWARRLDADGSPATAARKLAAMSSWYTWLVRNGHVTASPFGSVDRPQVNQDVSLTAGMTKDEAQAFLRAADRAVGPQALRNTAMLHAMLLMALRVSEVALAGIEDLGVNRGHRTLTVIRKGNKRQALVMPGLVAARTDAYLASRPDCTSLPAVPGEPGAPRPHRVLFATGNGQRLFRCDLRRIIRSTGKAAGLPAELVSHLGPHPLRHTAITLALDAGAPLRDVQDLAGHDDPRTTRRYDRSRHNLDRSPSYALASYLAASEG
jgi:integrase/recombinase XerD